MKIEMRKEKRNLNKKKNTVQWQSNDDNSLKMKENVKN